ncbi:hypothetical protein H311_00361 [Anncaliia algerae PRA109]|nr:hypothetical protein H311_00361 [Anncaliia algerae PRA109]
MELTLKQMSVLIIILSITLKRKSELNHSAEKIFYWNLPGNLILKSIYLKLYLT